MYRHNQIVSECFKNDYVLSSNRMLPHGSIHCRCQEYFVPFKFNIPSSNNTSLVFNGLNIIKLTNLPVDYHIRH